MVATDLDYPNGIVLSADSQNLLVAESYQNRILHISLKDRGVAARPPEVFAELPFNEKAIDRDNLIETGNLPDGIALDEAGRLWVAHYGMGALQVISLEGNHLATYDTGIPATSNLCFSGQSIYITGGKGEPGPGCLHRLQVGIKGLKMLKALLLVLLIHFGMVLKGQSDVQWEKLPPLPDKEGFAGMYAGVSHGTLLTMGGANFPEGRPWEGGEKVWYDQIYVLEKKDAKWKMAEERLPYPMAYGGAVSYENKIILIGGNDAKDYFSKVWSLEYVNGKVVITNEYPDFPVPIGYTSIALAESKIFVVGGKSSHQPNEGLHKAWVLDLSSEKTTKSWIEIEPCPEPPRFNAVAGAFQEEFYLFSGITMIEKDSGIWQRQILTDAYKFKPGSAEAGHSGQWIRLADMPKGAGAAPGPAILLSSGHFIIAGGVDAQIAHHVNPATHPGFDQQVISYHAESDKWTTIDLLPAGMPRVTAPSANWNGQWVIISGEKKPGVRSPEVYILETGTSLYWWNIMIVFLGIGIILLISWTFRDKIRKGFLSCLFLIISFFLLTNCDRSNSKISADKKPNILLIVSEDNGQDLGCYGAKDVTTPHLDKLGNEGVRFLHAYTTYSVCSPARSSIYTGLYPHQNGHIGLATHKYRLYKFFKTMPVFLKEAGYRTGCLGKIHVNPEEAIPFDFHPIKNSNFEKKNLPQYAREAGKFINKSNEPFFLMVNYPDAHYPLLKQVEGMPFLPMNGEDVSQLLPFIGVDSDRLRAVTADYYNSMNRLDEAVGLLLGELKASGKQNNTIIIYLSDHGAQFSRGKCSNYEAGLKIPLIVNWPKEMKGGQVRTELTSIIDLLPTLLDVAGKESSQLLPGISLIPLIKDEEWAAPRKYLFADGSGSTPILYFPRRSVRSERYKLIKNLLSGRRNPKYSLYTDQLYKSLISGSTQEEIDAAPEIVRETYQRWEYPPLYELYDLEKDPWEFRNLAADPEY